MKKVNLLIDNPGGTLSGYDNIDPFTPDDDKFGRIKGDVSNLDHEVDNGEASEILAHGILNYYSGEHVDGVLSNWVSKLAHGGQLTVSGVDLRAVCRDYLNGNLPIEDANEILFGTHTKPWDFKKSVFSIDIVEQVLRTKGLKILSKRVHKTSLYITCERP